MIDTKKVSDGEIGFLSPDTFLFIHSFVFHNIIFPFPLSPSPTQQSNNMPGTTPLQPAR